jgi:hypothetical protein
MENVKLTKKDYYEMIKGIVTESDVENKEELVAFVDKQVEAIDSRAAKAKERAASKKVEGDALRAQVEGLLTNEYQTAEDILAQAQGADLTKAKITARLTQLIKAGVAEKEAVKVEDRKVMGYRLIAE